jgi:hypothetical protein
MPRVRKLMLVAVVALVGGLTLSGCQNSPTTAVTMNGFSMQNSDVDNTFATVEGDVRKGGQQINTESYGDVRQSIVRFTVFNEIAKRYAQEKGYPAPTPDYNAMAQQIGLPPEDPFVKLYADTQAYHDLLTSKAAPATPTEADLREAYERYRVAYGDQALPYDQIKPNLQGVPEFAQAIGLRNELMAAAQRYGVSVNPRYAPLEMPLLSVPDSNLDIVALPLGDQGSAAVRDLS